MPRILCWMLLLIVLAPGMVLAETKVTVTKKEPTVSTRLFDPRNRPADMPPLNDGEAALCAYNVGASASAAASITERSDGVCSVELTEITVTLTCEIVLWLPEGYTRKIKDHEEAHQRITERVYADSDAFAREIAQKAAAKPIRAERGKCREAADRAMNDATSSITRQWTDRISGKAGKVNEIFDDLTDHGRNLLPEDKAIEQSFKQAEKN